MKMHPKKSRHSALLALVCLVIIITVCVFFSIKIDPILLDAAKPAALNMMNDAINSAQAETAEREDISYDKIVNISRDTNGDVTSVTVDSTYLNAISVSVNERVGELVKGKRIKVQVPMGTLSGVDVLSGKGPRPVMKIAQVTTVDTSTESVFDSAGINQTMHRIILHVITHTTLIFHDKTETIEYSADFVIAESIIVGRVPSINTN